jgi:acetyl-CoA carboxylase carboxyl transferase subunit beta
VELLIDQGTWEETETRIGTADPLRFRDHRRYSDRIKEARKNSGLNESICTGVGRLGGHPVALGVMDTRYILGSMGGATGEKICRLIDRAMADRRTLIIVCQSGGARMQESTHSLMQMAKVSARLHQLADAGLLYVSVLTDPTYGGVTASFAMLGDVILAEAGARIGFAGQAVIKQFLGVDDLPEGFQIAEGVKDHGFVDAVVTRAELAPTLGRLIDLLAPTDDGPAAPASRASATAG